MPRARTTSGCLSATYNLYPPHPLQVTARRRASQSRATVRPEATLCCARLNTIWQTERNLSGLQQGAKPQPREPQALLAPRAVSHRCIAGGCNSSHRVSSSLAVRTPIGNQRGIRSACHARRAHKTPPPPQQREARRGGHGVPPSCLIRARTFLIWAGLVEHGDQREEGGERVLLRRYLEHRAHLPMRGAHEDAAPICRSYSRGRRAHMQKLLTRTPRPYAEGAHEDGTPICRR